MAAGQSSKAATESPRSTEQQTRNKGRTPSLGAVPWGEAKKVRSHEISKFTEGEVDWVD